MPDVVDGVRAAARRRLARAVAVAAGVCAAALLTPLRAQADNCPSSTTTIGPISIGENASNVHPILLLPCQTLSVTLTGSSGTNSLGQVSMSIRIRTAAHADLLGNPVSFTCSVSCTVTAPSSGDRNGSPLPGTVGMEGRAAEIVVSTGFFNFFAHPPATYTLVVTQAGRDGYNEGADCLPDAPLIDVDVMQYGSVYPAESGQYYRVHLLNNQLIYLDGQATATTAAGSNFTIDILDASGTLLAHLVNVAAYGTKPFWANGASPWTYTNTGAEADFYLRAKAAVYMTSDFRFYLATPHLTVTPASPTRGQSATFTIVDARGATISNWQYVSTGHPTISRATNTAATTWPGKMVVSGTGQVTVGMSGRSIPLTASLSVTPRSWAWTPRPATKVAWGTTTPGGRQLQPANPPNGSLPAVGQSALEIRWSSVTTEKIGDGGPNDGFSWVTTQVTDSGAQGPSLYYWTLSPDIEDSSSTFYQKQCGNANQAAHTGYISGADLLANTTRHESGASDSHYANYVAAASQSTGDLGTIAETSIGDPSQTLADFGISLSNNLQTAVNGLVSAMGMENPPHPINDDSSGQWLGDINFAPNYASCTGGH